MNGHFYQLTKHIFIYSSQLGLSVFQKKQCAFSIGTIAYSSQIGILLKIQAILYKPTETTVRHSPLKKSLFPRLKFLVPKKKQFNLKNIMIKKSPHFKGASTSC